jgi:betaine reductase
MPGAQPLRVIHFLNQFFGGIGGEEAANSPVLVKDGPIGPGQALQQVLGDRGSVVGTIVAGDNFFNEHVEEAVPAVLEAIDRFKPDVLIAGPAFNAGRYGLACVEVCRQVSGRGIPAVTAMYPENPGLLGDRRDVYVVSTSESASDMARPMTEMMRIAGKLARGEKIGSAEEDGYIPRGVRVHGMREAPAAERAYTMLNDRLNGRPFTTEMAMLVPERATPATPISDLRHANVALITSGGLVPKGNPDRLVRAGATNWFRYSIDGQGSLNPDDWESVHAGFYTGIVNQNPDYILPLGAMRSLESDGEIGRVHPWVLTTTGVGTTLAAGKSIGQEMASELKSEGVDACLLVAT